MKSYQVIVTGKLGDELQRKYESNTFQGALRNLAEQLQCDVATLLELAQLADQDKLKLAFAGEDRIVVKANPKDVLHLDNKGVLGELTEKSPLED